MDCADVWQCGSVRQQCELQFVVVVLMIVCAQCAVVCGSALGSVWECARQCAAVRQFAAVLQCAAVRQCAAV
jgi:hypothetical protein